MPNASPSPRRAYSFKEGLAMMAAKECGVDPYLAAEGGDDARAVLASIRKAKAAKGPEKAKHIKAAQTELRNLSPKRHGKLINALQAKLLALQGRGGDTEVAHLSVDEFGLVDGLGRGFGKIIGGIGQGLGTVLKPISDVVSDFNQGISESFRGHPRGNDADKNPDNNKNKPVTDDSKSAKDTLNKLGLKFSLGTNSEPTQIRSAQFAPLRTGPSPVLEQYMMPSRYRRNI